MNAANEALRRAQALAQKGGTRDGLAVLEEALVIARSERDGSAVSRLAKHAATLASSMGDLIRTHGFYAEAHGAAPNDAYICLALAGALRALGQSVEARSMFERCLELGRKHGDRDVIDMACDNLDRST